MPGCTVREFSLHWKDQESALTSQPPSLTVPLDALYSIGGGDEESNPMYRYWSS